MNDLDRTELFITEGLNSLGLTSDVETEHESDTEAWVNLPQLNVCVLVDAEGTVRKGIGREVKGTKWSIYSVEDCGGGREPEDTDLVHRGDFDIMQDAVAEIFARVTRDHILNMIEYLGTKLDLDDEQREFEDFQAQIRSNLASWGR
jgi:hypothetical protein